MCKDASYMPFQHPPNSSPTPLDRDVYYKTKGHQIKHVDIGTQICVLSLVPLEKSFRGAFQSSFR